KNEKALISYVTAGDPHPKHTVSIMHALVEAGTDLIEVGVPFSDPMADGPVIQKACERALKYDTSLADILQMVKDFRKNDQDTPIILMGYQNPIEIYGVERFAEDAKGLVDGVITVDLPPEECAEINQFYREVDIDSIFLMAPTTDISRIRRISEMASGFLYYVSFKGITGANSLDIDSVSSKLSEIRGVTELPLAVGFGIKDAETAAAVAAVADAVVVGSAIVSLIAANQEDMPTALKEVKSLLQGIKSALDNAGSI
ncbi:MAG: tryptophan synthase subunit alpha, partial [Proteobacteria bacterium]|nr:tryptophan synthase subunit alpha [Pseudomonadota bacterium]